MPKMLEMDELIKEFEYLETQFGLLLQEQRYFPRIFGNLMLVYNDRKVSVSICRDRGEYSCYLHLYGRPTEEKYDLAYYIKISEMENMDRDAYLRLDLLNQLMKDKLGPALEKLKAGEILYKK